MAKLNLKFVHNRKRSLNKKGTAPVELRIHVSNKTKFVSTGIYLKEGQWREGVINTPAKEAADYRSIMSYMENEANQYYRNCLAKGVRPDAQSIKDRVLRKGEDDGEFVAFAENVFRNSNRSFGYLKQHPRIFDLLKKWENRNGKIRFSEVNYNFLKSFKDFIMQQPNTRYPKKTLSESYANQILKILKTYTNEALKSDLLLKDPFVGLKLKSEKPDEKYLTLSEVENIFGVELDSKGYWKEIRDAFCFSCWCGGWRFSDIFPSGMDENAGMRRRHIIETPNGFRVKKIPKKTSKRKQYGNCPVWKVPFGKGTEIIQERITGKGPDDFLFRKIDCSPANKYLKLIGKAAGIEQKLHFHLSRDTFINNMLAAGKRKEFVQAIVAHGSITTTERYVRNLDEIVDLLDV